MVTRNGIKKQYKVDGRRPKSNECELCHKRPMKRNGLGWHHWDDNHLEYGLWLCTTCHVVGNEMEKGITTEKYLKLREWAIMLIGHLKKSEIPTAVNVL